MNPISGQTGHYCLLGDPVVHSLSPWIMNRAFAGVGLDAVYTASPVAGRDLAAAVSGLAALNTRGANVTYPHKEAVLALITNPSADVRLLGAANTLQFTENGIAGFNTDASGTVNALECFGNQSIAGERAVILGAGGAARAAALGLLNSGIDSIICLARNPKKALAATRRLRTHFANRSFEVIELSAKAADQKRYEAIANATILINATPVGMTGVACQESPLALETPLHRNLCCLEMIYHPRQTPFLTQCAASETRCVEGLGLLIAQAQAAFRIWTGESFELEKMYLDLMGYLGESV